MLHWKLQTIFNTQAKEAIDVLKSINWNLSGNVACHILVMIADELLKEIPMAFDTEGFYLLLLLLAYDKIFISRTSILNIFFKCRVLGTNIFKLLLPYNTNQWWDCSETSLQFELVCLIVILKDLKT